MLHLLQKMVIYDLDFFFLDFYGAAGLELLCRDYRLQVNTTTTHVLLLLFATTRKHYSNTFCLQLYYGSNRSILLSPSKDGVIFYLTLSSLRGTLV